MGDLGYIVWNIIFLHQISGYLNPFITLKRASPFYRTCVAFTIAHYCYKYIKHANSMNGKQIVVDAPHMPGFHDDKND